MIAAAEGPSRGGGAGRSAQRACERSSDWPRGAQRPRPGEAKGHATLGTYASLDVARIELRHPICDHALLEFMNSRGAWKQRSRVPIWAHAEKNEI